MTVKLNNREVSDLLHCLSCKMQEFEESSWKPGGAVRKNEEFKRLHRKLENEQRLQNKQAALKRGERK